MDEHLSNCFWTKDEVKDFAEKNVYLEMPLVNMTYRMLDMAAKVSFLPELEIRQLLLLRNFIL